jgi:hypothetical protein
MDADHTLALLTAVAAATVALRLYGAGMSRADVETRERTQLQARGGDRRWCGGRGRRRPRRHLDGGPRRPSPAQHGPVGTGVGAGRAAVERPHAVKSAGVRTSSPGPGSTQRRWWADVQVAVERLLTVVVLLGGR